MRAWLFFVCVSVAGAADIPLCCGRGVAPAVAHSTMPLMERSSPFAGDIVLALDRPARGPEAQRLNDALARVAGVYRVEVEEVRPIARIWGAAALAELCERAREAGRTAVPTMLAKVPFNEAGEKGRIQRVSHALAAITGVVCLEIETEGEEGVARVWHRPGISEEILKKSLR